MSKKRVISSKMRASPKFASLTLRQRDLWHGIIVSVDDQGRMPGEPAYVRSQVWPYDDYKLDDVASDLGRLVAVGSIVIYFVNDVSYIQIVNWWKYQAMQWVGASDYPPPENWIDRERYHGAGNKIFTKNWESKGGFTQLPSIPGSKLPSKLPSELGTPREKEVVKGREKEVVKGREKDLSTATATTPLMAPDRILADASGLSVFPPNQIQYIEVVHSLVDDYGIEKTTEAMKIACDEWVQRRTKNGRPYMRTNLSWIDWAQGYLIDGIIPSQELKELSPEEKIKKLADQMGGKSNGI